MQFTLQLITTESCNLACKYCYMEHRAAMLKPHTLDTILLGMDKILSRFKSNGYQVSFFGGEPLLNWDLITYATPIFSNDSRCNNSVIISNALELTQDKVDYIKNNRIGFSCSFDGLWNNDYRPMRSGASSFDRFFEKQDLIRQLTSTVKSMVHPANLATMTENMEFFVDRCGMEIIDLSLVRDGVWNQEDIETYRKELRRLADRNIEYIKSGKFVLCNLFGLYLADIMAGAKYGKRPFSCFSGVNGMAFGEEEHAYGCARFYSARKLPLYNVKTQEFNENNLEIFSRKENNPKGHEKCQGCSLFTVCNTGCKFSEMDANNRIEPLDSICQIFHITYDETIRFIEAVKNEPSFKGYIKWRYTDGNAN